MKTSFAARRRARVVGQDDDDQEVKEGISDVDSQGETSAPVVKRPSSKPKHRSSLRLSFGPGSTSMTDDSSPTSEVFTPKKSNLSRQAISQNALRKSLAASDHLHIRQTDDRPSYSAAHLHELKTSTPSTPKDLRSLSDTDPSAVRTIDVASKFGRNHSLINSAIPTDAEIQEKKLRRAHLAKERKYNIHDSSASDDDDRDNREPDRDSDEDEFRNNANTVSLLPARSKHPETRLVRDDEDIMEDFDAFVEDGGVTLGRKAEREQKARKKAEIADLIAEAERGSSSEGSDDSEAERRAEYEVTQTRKGMDGMRLEDGGHEWGDVAMGRVARTPPKITPLPTLGGCLERLRARLTELEEGRARKVRELEEVEKERSEVREREEEIQRLLKETGERYERLRAEAGIEEGNGVNGLSAERGLENLGGTQALQAVGD